MSKYTDLQDESADNSLKGVRLVDFLSAITRYKGKVVIIRGLPACPHCQTVLTHHYIIGDWYCRDCGTGWSSEELAESLSNED